MLHDAKRLAKRGVAVHWLKSESKAPVDNAWSSAEVHSASELEATYREGYNVGARTGTPSEVAEGHYLYVIDVDVKGDKSDAEEAFKWLDKNIPNWEKLPYVQSGRGNDSQHIYVVFDSDIPAKKLAHSSRKVKWVNGAGEEKSSWAWEIERFGTGKQVAIPPSIHPDTGNAYKWGREINWDRLDDIYLDLAEIAVGGDEDWEESDSRAARDDGSSQSLSDHVKRRPLGLNEDEARDYLADLDHDKWCFDYEGWLKVGMALHHEFEGDAVGLDLWHDFSRDADNYDETALEDKWESFGKDKRRRPVRFATLIAAGMAKRTLRERKGADAGDEIENDDDPEVMASQMFDYTDKGEIKVSSAAVSVIFETDSVIRGILGMNQFSGEACIIKKPGKRIAANEKKQKQMIQLDSWIFDMTEREKREGKPMEDAHYHAIRQMIEEPKKRGGYGIKIPDRDFETAVQNAANRNPYHPVQAYLDTLKWDGEKRMDYLFVDYLGTPDDEYHRQCAALFLLAAVARVYQPGHKFDFVPILEGLQGIRKSTFVRMLGLHWYIELDCPFDDPKRVVENLVGSWIAEIPELSQFGKSEIAAIKAFFSKGEEKVREAYGRKAKRFPRQSVYMGTTNDSEYLRDPTGNRRFWPIKATVKSIDTEALKEVIPQIWAEATARYKEMAKDYPAGGLPLYLKGAEARDIAKTLQDSRVVETQAQGWAGLISAWANERVPQSVIDGTSEKFDKHDGTDDPLVRRELICGLQVWTDVLGGTNESYGRGNTLKVIEAIRATGEWEEGGREYLPGLGRQRVFKRVPKVKKSKTDLLA